MINLQKQHTKRIALGALFCALTLVATLFAVPVPITGNVNLGDGCMLLGAWFLGGPLGAVAVALGASLADLISGYAAYAPGTFLIKLAAAGIAILISRMLLSLRLRGAFCRAVAGFCAELIMVLGYFLYEAFILSYGALTAAANIPFNAVQGLVAILLSVTVYSMIERIADRSAKQK
jgi:uncharacterized membrane protein